MKHIKAAAKWISGLALVLVIALALTANDKSMLGLLEVGTKLLLLVGVIYGAFKASRERKESGLSKEAFQIAKAGGPEKLLREANQTRLLFYFLCALPIGFFIYSACNNSMEFAVKFLLILTAIIAPFAGIIYWSQNSIRKIANQELSRREQKGHSIDPYK
ncbi:hypothetical protein [Aquabacterium sp. CECT 9606]|uniref:hypothetical protein n=1 Tax=Aquabacterium sp. CECT 9606 TaxID=2845822 RepID=UPI001E58D2A0|nr:hypothetical protein [Aquabacterium sp. CECT 9606]